MSRSDQTRVCLPCSTRTSRRHAECARCGGELLDLRDEAAQRAIAAELATRQPASVRALAWLEDHRSLLYLGPLLAAVHPTGLKLAWLIGGPLAIYLDPGAHLSVSGVLRAIGTFLSGGAFWIVALLVVAVVGALFNLIVGVTAVPGLRALARRLRRRTRSVLTLITEPELDDRDAIEVRGQVRAIVPMLAPLTGRPCVAWTIACEGPGGDVADAGATRFELLTDDGVDQVVLDAGDLVLDDGDPCELGRGSVALSGWSPGRVATPLIAVEAILADGDHVEVFGPCQRGPAAEPGDHRAGRVHRTFREVPDGPSLRIRRIPRT